MSRTPKTDAGSKKSKNSKNAIFHIFGPRGWHTEGAHLGGTGLPRTIELRTHHGAKIKKNKKMIGLRAIPTLPPGARAREKFNFLGFFDFWDPAPVLGVLDIVLLIPEVWDFYLLSNATFFSS